VKENSPQTQYQLIYSKVETSCKVFGTSDIGSLHPWGTDLSQAGHNRYVWILWRHYHGCIQGDGKYIGHIDF
jgi:hypothetical protein